jgi:hypothetical protein
MESYIGFVKDNFACVDNDVPASVRIGRVIIFTGSVHLQGQKNPGPFQSFQGLFSKIS